MPDIYWLRAGGGEDAASTAIFKLIDYAKKQREYIKSPDAFMRTLVKHTALDMLRAERPFAELDEARYVQAPDDLSEVAAERNDVLHAIGQLGDSEREIAVMFYIYGIKIKEIADELEMPVGTVKWHLSQIRTKLSKII